MTRVVITGGRVIDPANKVDDLQDVYIVNGKIAAVGPTLEGFQPDVTVNAKDQWVIPGLVDLFARLREPGQEHKATIESETRAAVKGGITALSCPPDTTPVIDTPAMVHMVRDRADEFGRTRIHPLGALTVGLKGQRLTDMAALKDAGCAGVSNAFLPVENTLVMRRAMQYAATFDLTIFIKAADPWLMGNGCIHEGAISTRLGLPAIPEAAETVAVARDLALIETTGVRAHFCQLSSARAVDMIAEARRRGLPVSADVSIHHLHLTEHDIGYFDTQCYVLPPLRGEKDRDGLRQALADSVVSAVCSDHQPHGADAKLAPIDEAAPGISGLETLLPLTLRLVDQGVLSIGQAITAITLHPATILGTDGGTLKPGAYADVCIVNPNAEYQLTENDFASNGKNSPFIGERLRGRVTKTLMKGVVVYDREIPLEVSINLPSGPRT